MITNFYSPTLSMYFYLLQCANRISGRLILFFISLSAIRITNDTFPLHPEKKYTFIRLILSEIASVKLKRNNFNKATRPFIKIPGVTSQSLKVIFKSMEIPIIRRSGLPDFRPGTNLQTKYNTCTPCFSKVQSASPGIWFREILPCFEAWKYLLINFSNSQVMNSFLPGNVNIFSGIRKVTTICKT